MTIGLLRRMRSKRSMIYSFYVRNLCYVFMFCSVLGVFIVLGNAPTKATPFLVGAFLSFLLSPAKRVFLAALFGFLALRLVFALLFLARSEMDSAILVVFALAAGSTFFFILKRPSTQREVSVLSQWGGQNEALTDLLFLGFVIAAYNFLGAFVFK